MEYTFAQYQESAQALRDRLGAFRPRCLLILGSGLGSLGNEVESPIAVPYEDVPHMKRSTAPDHAGRFVFGRLAGQDVAVMQGRLHTYEGWSFEDVSYPVRVLDGAFLALAQQMFADPDKIQLWSVYLANAACVLLGILAGVIVYGVLVIALRILRAEDVRSIPRGEKLIKLLHLK